MPEKLRLNGMEVAFSTDDSNEDPRTHVSVKNVVPLQHRIPPPRLGCFVDMCPPGGARGQPALTIMDTHTARVLHTGGLRVHESFGCRGWRGSTPLLQLDGGMWIVLVHRTDHRPGGCVEYRYIFAVYSSTTAALGGDYGDVALPDTCVYEVPLDIRPLLPRKEDFVYITGLALDAVADGRITMILSYGISDRRSAVCPVTLALPPLAALAPVRQLLRPAEPAVLVCRQSTIIKALTKQGAALEPGQKRPVLPGERFAVLREAERDHCKVAPLSSDRPPELRGWYVYTPHFKVSGD